MAAAELRVSQKQSSEQRRLDYCVILSSLAGSIEKPTIVKEANETRPQHHHKMSTSQGSPLVNLGLNPKPRRIVRASQPRHDAAASQASIQTKEKDDTAPHAEKDAPERRHSNSYPRNKDESARVIREMHQDNAHHVRHERQERAKDQLALKREKKIIERRHNPEPTGEGIQANPFARFMSAFSVLPKHPEHKRTSRSKSLNTDDLLEPPTEKRLRKSTSVLFDSDAPDNTPIIPVDNIPPTGNPLPLIVSSVAIAFIAVVLATRWSRPN
jgi:hypothetical protein